MSPLNMNRRVNNMGWGNITGDERIIPGSGNGNEIKFEKDKPKKLRILMTPTEEPYSYFEHTIEVDTIENGVQKRVFRTIRCPQTKKNPYAKCKLCEGQRSMRRVRNAANAWDYDLGMPQKLNGGEQIWKPIATSRKLGVDILAQDWGVLKTGEGRNDTDYTVQPIGATPFTLPENVSLFNIEEEYRPHTEEEAREIVESCGLIWDEIIVPPSIDYSGFTSLQAALDHKMPNGKYKDQTFKQMWESDPTNKGMINFLATKSDRISPEKSAAQIIMVNLGGANIAGVPRFNGTTEPVQATAPVSTAAPVAGSQPAGQPAGAPVNTGAPVGTDRQGKINEINGLLSTKEKFVKGGFAVIVATMKEASGGKTNIVEFSDTELDTMLAKCKE